MLLLVAAAAPASADARLRSEVGYGGFHHGGTDLPVTVTIESDQLITGELRVTSSQGGIQVTVPVELAGGSTKAYEVVLPGVTRWGNSILIELVEGEDVTQTQRQSTRWPDDSELVGVTSSLSSNMPATVDLAVEDLGEARLFALTNERLESGIGALDTLDMVVTNANDLSAAGPAAQDAIAAWLSSGGVLIVDNSAGIPLAGLDTAAPAANSSVNVGRGQLRSVDGAAERGDWDGLLFPTEFSGNFETSFVSELTGDTAWFGQAMSTELARDAGFSLPPLPWLIGLLFVYVMAAGPLTWFVLRKLRKLSWMWGAIPALALLFTGGVWVAGSALRSDTSSAHATMIEAGESTAYVQSTYLLSSKNGGTEVVDLAPGWKADQDDQSVRFMGIPGGGGSPISVSPSGQGSRVTAQLDAGGFVTVGASGPDRQFAQALVVEATSAENNTLSGTVTNNLSFDVHEVGVFADTAGKNIGTVGAGQVVRFEIERGNRDPRFGNPIEFDVWPAEAGGQFMEFGPFGQPIQSDEVSDVNVSAWAQYVNQNTGSARPMGEVVAVGWTSELAAPQVADIAVGRTGIIARARIEAPADVTNLTVVRELIRSPESLPNGEPGFNGDFDAGFIVGSGWRFTLPEGVDPAVTPIGLNLPNGAHEATLWLDGEWVDLGVGRVLMEIPPEAFIEGALYVNLWINFDRNGLVDRNFSLQEIREQDTSRPFELAGAIG